MLHILWIIIKFILILLGIILGLILLALLLVLFCPFRYHASAEKLDEDFKKTRLNVSASWLFYAVWIRLSFQEGSLGTKINLFGIPIHKIIEKRKSKDAVSEKSISEKNIMVEQKVEEAEVQTAAEDFVQIETEPGIEPSIEPSIEPGIETSIETNTEQLQENLSENLSSDVQENIDEPQPDDKEDDKTVNILVKIRNILDAVSGKLKSVGKSGSIADKIANKVNAVKEKVQGILDKINWWKRFITHPKVKGAVVCVKGAIFKIVRHIIPTRLYGNITFGSEDPAATGTVLAILGITMPFHKNCVEVTPVFDGKNVLTGKVQLKGRIYVFILLFQALKVLINKNVRYTIKYWKNKEES